jgi:hypothetical protein
MTFENVRIKDSNFAFDGLYFYTVDNDSDSLIQKTDDGNIAFTFPLNRNVTNEIISLHYEGIMQPYRAIKVEATGETFRDSNPSAVVGSEQILPINGMSFWTLERDGSNGLIIRKFTIQNFSAIEEKVLNLPTNPGSNDVFDVNQMAVELYETSLAEALTPGETSIDIFENLQPNTGTTLKGTGLFTKSTNIPNLPETPDTGSILPLVKDDAGRQNALLKRFRYDKKTAVEADTAANEIIIPSMVLTIGPSTSPSYFGKFVQVVVTTALVSGSHLSASSAETLRVITTAIPTGAAFEEGDPIRFAKNIFLFNNNGSSVRGGPGEGIGTGSLYVVKSYLTTPSIELYLGGTSGGLFKGTEGAVFSQRDRKVIFTRATNAIFMEPNVNDIKFSKTATLDNFDNTANEPIPIFDLAVSFGGTLFRLQNKQEFDGGLESWGDNNYVVSPLFSLVKSVSVRAEPQIIAADGGADRSDVTVTVRDQFNQPVENITVTLGDDNAVGRIVTLSDGDVTFVSDQTDTFGQVRAVYRSGDDDVLVKITATVAQLSPA